MIKINEVVFDAGPFIHLQEVKQIDLVTVFIKILTTVEILEECKRMESIIKHLQNVEEKILAPFVSGLCGRPVQGLPRAVLGQESDCTRPPSSFERPQQARFPVC